MLPGPGADDYLTQPFNPRKLVARVKAILRRGERKDSDAAKPIHIGDLTIDPARREVCLPDTGTAYAGSGKETR